MTKLRFCKAILDFFLFLIIGNAAVVMSYLWMVVLSGWVTGEMLFDREMFHQRYGRDTRMGREAQELKDYFKGGPA